MQYYFRAQSKIFQELFHLRPHRLQYTATVKRFFYLVILFRNCVLRPSIGENPNLSENAIIRFVSPILSFLHSTIDYYLQPQLKIFPIARYRGLSLFSMHVVIKRYYYGCLETIDLHGQLGKC